MSKTVKIIVGVVLTLFLLLTISSGFKNFFNEEVTLTNKFEQKKDERTASYTKMLRTITPTTQIAVKVDSSFIKVVKAQVEGQKMSENLTWAWIKQANPTATYGEVSKMYQELNRVIQAESEQLFEQEKFLQDVQRQHKNLTRTFPGNIYSKLLGVKQLEYIPLQTSETRETMKTGIEKDYKIDL